MKHRSPHWHFAARLTALVSVLVGFGLTLVVAGPTVLFAFAFVCFLIYVIGLVVAILRAEKPGGHCDRIDQELEREDRRRLAQERAAVSELRVHRNVTALPQRPPADVIPFPDRTAR